MRLQVASVRQGDEGLREAGSLSMLLVLQCPRCYAKVKVPESALTVTCTKCFATFNTAEDDAIMAKQRATKDRAEEQQREYAEEPSSIPDWINPWGAGGFILATLGLLAASLIGIRWLTLTLAGLGLVVVLIGMVRASRKTAQGKDVTWLGLGALVSAATVLVTVFAGGLLNRFWAMDGAVPVPDPHHLVVVRRETPREAGRPLLKDEWANAVTEAVRQDDVTIRVQSAIVGPIPEQPGKTFFLIAIRLGSSGNEREVVVESFTPDKFQPSLKDDSGRSFAFVEQRLRKMPAGALLFIPARPQTFTLGPGSFVDSQLVFEAPTSNFPPLKLELPAAAYGRKGAVRLKIPEAFEAALPEVPNK